jgi:hypothetical protein
MMTTICQVCNKTKEKQVRRFRLLNDLPDFKSGKILIQLSKNGKYRIGDPAVHSRDFDSIIIEHNPEWFEEIKEWPDYKTAYEELRK